MSDDQDVRLDSDEVYFTGRGLLGGGWLCAPAGCDVAALVEAARRLLLAPCVSNELVADRLFGGFACEDERRRHVHFAGLRYTFIDLSANRPMTPEDRFDVWSDLVATNPPGATGGFRGGGPCTGDAPEVTRESR